MHKPFDYRWLFHAPSFVDRPRSRANRNVLHGSLSLVTTRQTKEAFGALVTDRVCSQHKIVSVYDRSYVFPFHVYPADDSLHAGEPRWANLSHRFLTDVSERLGLEVSDSPSSRTTCPDELFSYIYAILYSPTYRARYQQLLQIEFPRVPMPSDLELFRRVARLGAELISLHLLQSPLLNEGAVHYEGEGDDVIDVVRYDAKMRRVYVNHTQYFEGIGRDAYEYHIGGYQVLEKWLDDRKGQELTFENQVHYRETAVALLHTMRLMRELDDAIPNWPVA